MGELKHEGPDITRLTEANLRIIDDVIDVS